MVDYEKMKNPLGDLKFNLTHSSTYPTQLPDMNNEPKIELPKPPTDHVWQYRGMGWRSESPVDYAVATPYEVLTGKALTMKATIPNANSDRHYWEAVPVTKTPLTDKILLEHAQQLETELDAAKGIAEALEEDVAGLKLALEKLKADFARADHDRHVATDNWERAIRERDGWEQTAAQQRDGAQYYRNLLVECGEAIGKEAYTCDAGTTQQDVLAAKVPELVRGLVSDISDYAIACGVARGQIDFLEDERRSQVAVNPKWEDTVHLIYDIMRDEVNAIDECEKWLRYYAPEKLNEAYQKPDFAEGGKYEMLIPGVSIIQMWDEVSCEGVAWTPYSPCVIGEVVRAEMKARRPVPIIDYAQQAKDIFRKYIQDNAMVDMFVDLIIRAAKQ